MDPVSLSFSILSSFTLLYNSTSEDITEIISVDSEHLRLIFDTTDKKYIGQYIFTFKYSPESNPDLVDDTLTIDLLVLELLTCYSRP